MKALLAVFLMFCLLAPAVRAGLYDSDKNSVTSGDLDDQDYWWTKFDMMMLDKALEQKQPEGRIAVNLEIARRRLDDLIKKYPKHEDLKKWKEKVEDINKKIDPNANRREDWKPGCPWDEANFAQAWVNYHWGKMQIEAKEIQPAKATWSNVKQNFDTMLQKDRMKDYPEDLRKWMEEKKDDVDKTWDDLKKR
jgi:hypothetical protein